MEEELFRKSSLEKLSAPEKLDEYIEAPNPRAWMMIAGVGLLLLCAVIWMGASRIKITVSAKGIVHDGEFYLYFAPEQAEELEVGMNVECTDGGTGTVVRIGSEPERREKAGGTFLTEYYRATVLSEWNTEVVVCMKEKRREGEEAVLSVVKEEINPLQFFMQ